MDRTAFTRRRAHHLVVTALWLTPSVFACSGSEPTAMDATKGPGISGAPSIPTSNTAAGSGEIGALSGAAGRSSTSNAAAGTGAIPATGSNATNSMAAGASASAERGNAAAGTAGSNGQAPGASATPTLSLQRPLEPVVLTGNALMLLMGKSPAAIVAFRYAGGAWKQLPLQIDERAKVDFYDIYNKQYSSRGAFVNLNYVDSNTLSGPDPDPMIDADDELVFMARDTGDKPAAFNAPEGVKPDSGIVVHLRDAKDAQKEGYIYLFEHDGTLKPDAGVSYGTYTFKLKAGNYPADYGFRAGPNPEDSTFKSAAYEWHFSDRWLSDVLRVTVDGASGADILDVQETRLLDGCTRHIGTFDMGEGAFATNKPGPIRTIRSYVGANSGPLTQRTHKFYDARQDQISELRVHAVPSGPSDTLDFGPGGVGLTYYDANNSAGALIDGTPDTLKAATDGAPLPWNMVTGAQGTVVSVFEYDTDIAGLRWSSVFVDEKDTRVAQCNGDTKNAYGESGPAGMGALPTTDPTLGATNKFNTTRIMYYLGPNAQVADAQYLNDQLRNPLVIEVAKP